MGAVIGALTPLSSAGTSTQPRHSKGRYDRPVADPVSVVRARFERRLWSREADSRAVPDRSLALSGPDVGLPARKAEAAGERAGVPRTVTQGTAPVGDGMSAAA